MTDTLEILNGQGHLSISWDPDNPEEVAEARIEVERLKAIGYSFFLVDDGPADEVSAGHGALDVRKIDDPTRLPSVEPPERDTGVKPSGPWAMPEPEIDTPGDPQVNPEMDDDPEPQDVDHRTSEYKAWKRRQQERQAGRPASPGRRTVGVAPMRGGA